MLQVILTIGLPSLELLGLSKQEDLSVPKVYSGQD